MGERTSALRLPAVSTRANAFDLGELDRAALATPAVLAMAALFGSRLAINARINVPVDLVALQEWLLPLSAIACAGSLLAIALAEAGRYETVGLAFVGGFGIVGTVARPAAVPAVVAIVVGTAIAMGERGFGDDRRLGRAVIVGLLVCGLASSLAATVGFEPAVSRSVGTQVTLLGIAGTPLLLARSRRDWLAGALGGGLLIALGLVAPFLLGATGLVAGGIVGASLPLMALAVGGLTTTLSASLRTRQDVASLGAGLLLFAGMPSTIPRALALVLALTLLVEPTPGGAERV